VEPYKSCEIGHLGETPFARTEFEQFFPLSLETACAVWVWMGMGRAGGLTSVPATVAREGLQKAKDFR
jgi:hypothetical protein